MKTLPILLCLLTPAIFPQAQAASVYLKSAMLAGYLLQDAAGVPLTAGSGQSGTGSLLEFGYYSAATSASPFAGQWNPLTGPDSAGMVVTTIGSNYLPKNGYFSQSLFLDTTLPGFPADGIPLALRFYNGKTRANSTAFNAVANTAGLWDSNSIGTQISISIGAVPGTVWQSGPASAFRTAIPIPESGPSVLVSAAAALAALAALRRRRPARAMPKSASSSGADL